jgi:hypothetical protein
MANRTFSGSVELSAPVLLTADCLGETIQGRIASTSFTLTFPTPSGEGSPLKDPDFHEPYWLEQDDGTPRFWGLDFGETGCLVRGVAAVVETQEVPLDCPSDVAAGYVRDDFGRAFSKWLDDVSTYLELWAGQAAVAAYASRVAGPQFHLFDHANDTGVSMQPDAAAIVAHGGHLGDFRPVRISDWRSAAGLVSAGTPPDRAWSLFRRACRFAQDDPRAAAIDACAAAEIAVGKRVTDTLYGHPDEAKDLIIQNTGGLIGLVALADRLFGKPDKLFRRPDYSNQLAKVRNSAAHKGTIPSPDAVDDALRSAKWLLNHYLPLPEPTED